VCDNRTVTDRVVASQADLGHRIAQGREEAGLTQAELAVAVGIDRTALAKIETGTRRVSATELVVIARALSRAVDWFVSESPPAVISRRSDPGVGGRSARLDALVDRIGRDVAFLLRESVLPTRERNSFAVPTNFPEAEQLAADARQLMHASAGPLIDIQRRSEEAGLFGFALDLGEAAGDAAYVEVDGWGVAVINGAADAGRRRFNLAHELGHHLVGDAYAAEVDVSFGNDTEKFLNAFAAYLLMPRAEVSESWSEFASRDRRLAAVAVATRFRVSWSAACSHLRNLGVIESDERDQLEQAPPTRGDSVELGEWWIPELEAPSVPPEYGQRVIRAYRVAKITAPRVVELLWGTVPETELPERESVPIDALRREFEPLQ